MKRPILLAIFAIVLIVLFAAAAEGVQSRLRPQPPVIDRTVQKELPREWVWRKKSVRFDDMIREPEGWAFEAR